MNWKKAAIIVLDLVIGFYLVLAVTAFNKPDEHAMVCNEVNITIEKEQVDGFLTVDKVRYILQKNRLDPMSEPMTKVNTRQIEETLQANSLIDKAECYKTQTGRVCIHIKQRIPVVRVMSQNNECYFVDNKGEIMTCKGYTCNTLVATGFISKAYARKVLAPLASTIIMDNFWRSQVVQLNVLEDGAVEIIPRVGQHVACLGQPVDVPRKLERLRKFYRYGLNQAGWNQYDRVSVEFDNQIVCRRKKG